MIVGAILQATSFSYAQMLVARVITGLGNGLNVGFNVPMKLFHNDDENRLRQYLLITLNALQPHRGDG